MTAPRGPALGHEREPGHGPGHGHDLDLDPWHHPTIVLIAGIVVLVVTSTWLWRHDHPAGRSTGPAESAIAASGSGMPALGTATPGTESSTSTQAPVPTSVPAPWQLSFLACVRARESRGNYGAVSPSGGFFGAYQIDQVTWDSTVVHAGIPNAYKVQPNLAAPAVQDAVALALLQWQGPRPWAGNCRFPA